MIPPFTWGEKEISKNVQKIWEFQAENVQLVSHYIALYCFALAATEKTTGPREALME